MSDLSFLLFLPALAGLFLALFHKVLGSWIKPLTLGVTLVTFGLSLALVREFNPSIGGMQLEESHSWVFVEGLVPKATSAAATSSAIFDIRYQLGIDALSLLLILLTTFILPLAVLGSWQKIQSKGFYLALLFLETGMIGALVAQDVFLFYIFWEVMLIPMYAIIGIWGGKNRIYAAMKFILYTMIGSLVMLVALIYLYVQFGTFNISALQSKCSTLPLYIQDALFLAFALSFAIKTPLFPLHTWLPDAHVEAPTAGSVILAGVLLKMGVYGFLRFAIPFFPDSARYFSPLILTLAVVGIIYGALMALSQTDIKKLIAYSSVSHLGFVILGIFSFHPAGVMGGVYQMLNHGISTGALFLLVGLLYDRAHKRGVQDFGGLATSMPCYATLFMIVTLSSIGLPGTNGFVGEFLILSGAFVSQPLGAILGGTGVVLGAIYMLNLYRNMMFGTLSEENRALEDTTKLELLYLLPLVVLIFVMGFCPNLFLESLEAFSKNFIQLLPHS
jgi:NADH-quinone oxidoreductase subunit M